MKNERTNKLQNTYNQMKSFVDKIFSKEMFERVTESFYQMTENIDNWTITEYGEPLMFYPLPNGMTLKVCHERNGVKDWYFSGTLLRYGCEETKLGIISTKPCNKLSLKDFRTFYAWGYSFAKFPKESLSHEKTKHKKSICKSLY